MKILIASDIHGSAKYCRMLLEAYTREKADRLLLLGDILYHGPRNDLPDEYAHSEYTRVLKGAYAKAKANATQGLPEMIENATGKSYTENGKIKHSKDARYGWYKFDARFALPVFGSDGEVERYNVFHAAMIFRHGEDGKKYLYDIMNIKKETSNLFQP